MNNFKKYNLIAGWFSFAFAAVVYIMTIEPSTSFWDCAEFIATSYKMEVGHPPGAPLFMMLSRFFMIFTSDPLKAAMMGNVMSATASAATIMFLFWTITHLARKMYRREESELTNAQTAAVIGAGLIGAIAYTFTDTFWFSAVEAEVYALSSLFTAVVFWMILKWENVADQPHANRWLILIAYMTGLSIGVHLLNLLVIPAIVFIYYFRKYPEVTKRGIAKALAVSLILLGGIMFVIIPGTINLGAFIDRVFVNSFGLPVNSGIITYAVLLFAALWYGIFRTYKKGKLLYNTILLCITVIVLGYASYASVMIRANANPPMNSNNPDIPYSLLSLLSRVQYGSRPLLYGPAYSAPAIDIKTKTTYYVGEDGKYKPGEMETGAVSPDGFDILFPRMHAQGEEAAYRNWVDIKGKQVPFNGEAVTVPTFAENLQFFFSYQMNFMFWRYFLWNFAGRQSDIQSRGEITDGNWLSGIKAVDQLYLGPQDDIPSEMAANKGRNRYYFLPFILGLVGLIYQLNRDGRNFTVVMTLFIMTGIAIVVYLNSPPSEPRERDYVYAGAFYAFAVWLGFGVLALYEWLGKKFKKESVATAIAATAVCACVPAILGAENWDDHDRSHRYVARDFGHNYLKSTLPNSILMNYGDNDAFPLWYAQEVEGVREDVKIMNMSYLGGEWYIDQMRIKSNDADPVPFSIPREKYMYKNVRVPVLNSQTPVDIRLAIELFKSEDPRTKIDLGYGPQDVLPSRVLTLPVNKENAVKSGIVREEDAHLMVDTITITIPSSSVLRNDVMMLDLFANFDWNRPLYFSNYYTISSWGLEDYMQLDGFSYRFVPIKTTYDGLFGAGRVDSEYLYGKVMNEFRYGNVADPRVYADYFINTFFESVQGRNIFARLAEKLVDEGKPEQAIEVLDRAVEVMPFSQIRHSAVTTLPIITTYYYAGDDEKANAILQDYARILKEYISYYLKFTGKKAELTERQLREKAMVLNELYNIAQEYEQTEVASSLEEFFKSEGLM